MNKIYLTILGLTSVVLGVIFISGNVNNKTISSGTDNPVVSVNALEFSKLVGNKDNFLLDVHVPEQTHIPGTDAFIPFNEIPNNLNKLPMDKNTKILVYCRSGSMSKQAALELHDLGYTDVISLSGGTDEYKKVFVDVEINPSVQDLGTVIYGDVATTEFVLTNYTPLELAVTRVATSCGCTSAEVVKTSLAPYESTVVNVSFDPAVHKDDSDLGQITRTIYIDTDNQDFQQVTSAITANVVKKD